MNQYSQGCFLMRTDAAAGPGMPIQEGSVFCSLIILHAGQNGDHPRCLLSYLPGKIPQHPEGEDKSIKCRNLCPESWITEAWHKLL